MLLSIPRLVSAHVLLTSGSIGAVLHIDPDDDPIANQPSTFFFDFKDTTNHFSLQTCDCQFGIFSSGKQIFNQPLPASTKTTATVTYTFLTRSVYTIKVAGKPTDGSSFSPFTLSYDVRVSRSSNQPQTENGQSPYLLYIVGVSLLVFLIIFVIMKQRKSHVH